MDTLPRVIDHRNMGPILDRVASLPCFRPGPAAVNNKRSAWVDREVTLEIPTGELLDGWLKRVALAGLESPPVLPLTGREGFAAQGLEGKVQIHKDLFAALTNLRDLIPPHRGRILTGAVR